MIIDIHTHIFKDNICTDREGYLSDKNFMALYSDKKSKVINHSSLYSSMKDGGIDYAVGMGFPWFGKKFCEEQNEYFSRVYDLTEGRVLPFGSVPLDEKEDIKGWVKDIKEKKLFGISEIGFYADGMGEESLNYLEEIFKSAQMYSLPVSLHLNEPVGHPYTGKYNPNFSELYKILSRYSEVTIIFAHWGGGLLFYELMPEIGKKFNNFYYDTAASPYLYNDKIYRVAIDILGSEKILFGSDFPLIKFSKYIDSIDKLKLDETAKNNILGLNAASLFGLK